MILIYQIILFIVIIIINYNKLFDMTDFTETSKKLNTVLSKETRKKEGIFFTPKNVRNKIIEVIDDLELSPKNILEPSCGSGEFLEDVKKYKAKVTAIEYNKQIYSEIKKKYTDDTEILNMDFLQYKNDEKFDLIIGNPPYFVTAQKNKKCMSGRGNIFVLFIYKCLTEHLKDNGLLAFVLPTSFYNCKYYEPCRRYIYENMKIVHLENVEAKYIDTTQSTMIMCVMNKTSKSKPYFLNFKENLCLSPHHKQITNLLKGSSTIKDLGCTVKTGEVVWNEHKDKLNTNDGVPVIYSSNIVDNNLVLNNLSGEKKQYIQDYKKTPTKGPAILISRGYGNNYIFSYTYIKDEFEFFGENHINVVTGKKESLDRIFSSLEDKRMIEFIKLYTGNGALSKTEIENILPIF